MTLRIPEKWWDAGFELGFPSKSRAYGLARDPASAGPTSCVMGGRCCTSEPPECELHGARGFARETAGRLCSGWNRGVAEQEGGGGQEGRTSWSGSTG